jgi:hypothetical protein
VPGSVPVIEPGECRAIDVTFQNVGSATWTETDYTVLELTPHLVPCDVDADCSSDTTSLHLSRTDLSGRRPDTPVPGHRPEDPYVIYSAQLHPVVCAPAASPSGREGLYSFQLLLGMQYIPYAALIPFFAANAQVQVDIVFEPTSNTTTTTVITTTSAPPSSTIFTTTTHAPITTTVTTTTTTVPCTTARCTLGTALHSPACAGQTIPATVTGKFATAENLIDQAATTTGRNARKVRRQAKNLLRQAITKATRAAKRKGANLSAACAATLRDAASHVAADQ